MDKKGVFLALFQCGLNSIFLFNSCRRWFTDSDLSN